ncbi:hypothetical protein ACWGH2_42030 [Streptomyces sp. NPDC054871]
MLQPTGLDVSVFRAGGDPDKPYVTVSVQISADANALTTLPPEEREALLRGALEGIKESLLETRDTAASLTFTEVVPVA